MAHLDFALVILGPPRVGKTPLAKSLLAAISMIHQEPGIGPFGLVVSTVEAMPRSPDCRVRAGVPVLFDDMRPGVQRLSRPAHTLEDMKTLGEVRDGGQMAARYSDIHFEPNMSRVFTSNDSTPHAFFGSFPVGLEAMSDADVMRLDDHTLALVKRFAFLRLDTPVVPAAARAAFDTARRGHALQAAAAHFSGEHAIP